jgi:hypothetical protein
MPSVTTPLHSARLLARAGLAAALAFAAMAAGPAAAAGTLTLASGTPAPVAATVPPGTSGAISARFQLTAAGSQVTVSAITLTTSGTAVADRDVSSIALFDVNGATTTYVGTAMWNGTAYKASNINYAVQTTTARTVSAVVNYSQGATPGRAITVSVTAANITSDGTVSGSMSSSVAITVGAANTARKSGNNALGAPMVSILIPAKGQLVAPTLSGNAFRVKVRISNLAAAGMGGVSAIGLSTTNGTTWQGTAFTENTNYDYQNPNFGNAVTGATFEPSGAGSISLPAGCYTLRARATANSQTTESEPVPVCIGNPGAGDGNLLVRENANQLCADCHAVASHDTENVGTSYGSWATTCRDCHWPHGTRNRNLVTEYVIPPSIAGTVLPSTNVGFVTAVGANTGNGWNVSQPNATASYVNQGDNAGPCQACHSRTQGAGGVKRWQRTGNSDTSHYPAGATQACTNCHAHTKGFAASCTGCHGTPGRSTFASEAPPKDTCGNSASGTSIVAGTMNRVGAHAKHLQGGTLSAGGVTCSQCHLDPPSRPGHPDSVTCSATSSNRAVFTWGNIANGSKYAWSTVVTPTYNYSTGACNNYCHGNFKNGNTANAPTWNGTVACGSCHGTQANPQPASGHPTLTAGTVCSGCHPGYTQVAGTVCATPSTCVNQATHINGQLEVNANCTDCHANAVTMAAGGTRRAIVPEFSGTWSHKRSAGGSVTNFDCCVCHMEGDVATGKINTLYHGTGAGDGVLDFRDPDLGTRIKKVYFSQSTFNDSNNGGSYQSYTTDATPTRFIRNLASNQIEADAAAIQINLCLKCHDNNGATSPLANVPTGGSPGKPFGVAISAPNNYGIYTGGNGLTACPSGTNGCVVDVKSSFVTSNSSYHPVMGKQNNSYTGNAQMSPPWNSLASNKTGGTISAVNSWGFLITCWDCHSPPLASGTQTATVTAHGGYATLRAGVWNSSSSGTPGSSGATTGSAQANLCRVCHFPSSYTSGAHGAGSAIATVSSQPQRYMPGACFLCHLSAQQKPPRPVPAQDIHGFNAFSPQLGTDTRWPVGTTNSQRPYGFMRNAGTSGGTLGGTWNKANDSQFWRPKTGPDVMTGGPQCGGNSAVVCSSDNHGTYAPGGVY